MIGSIREYFLLSEARATAKLVPEDARVALHDKLSLGRQRAEAADALWSNGHVAEGLRLAGEAFYATLEAVDPFRSAVQPRTRERTDIGEAPTELASPEDEGASEPGAADDAEPEAVDASGADGAADEATPQGEGSDAGVEVAPTAPVEADPADASDLAALLRRYGLSEGKTREVVEVERALQAKSMPLLDHDVSAAEGELFQSLIAARRHVDRVLAPASRTPKQLGWTRVSRIGFAIFIAALCLVGLYFALAPETGFQATASAEYRGEFSAEKAVDGDETTEWLLPDDQAGSIDLRVVPTGYVETLRIKNAHNRGFNDRATRAYKIEVFVNGEVVRTIEDEFSRLDPNPAWVEHAINLDDVERFRITVESWHRSGGGLAEIEWE